MKVLKLSLLCFLVLLSSNIIAQSEYSFDQLFAEWENNTKPKPGVAVAIIDKGKIVFKKSYGTANLEYDIPIKNNSVFDIASLAKQFTGFAVAKLILDKELTLEDNVQDYLPELIHLNNKLKIKHLVYHTSGLRDIGELFPLSYYNADLTAKEGLEIIKNQKELNFKEGTEYDYSNTNYVLLALIVERVTNTSFKDYCRDNIFRPLGMNDSFANDNPKKVIKNRVMAYYTEDMGYSYLQNNGMSLIGSSAVFSSIDDLAKWVLNLQNGGQFYDVFQLMKTKGKLDNGEVVNYGFGLGIGDYNGVANITHSGATPSGFRAQIASFPENRFSFVILSNWGDIDPISKFGIDIINILTGMTKDNEETNKVKLSDLPEESLEQYVGDYMFNSEMKVVISKNENTLTILLEGQQPHEIFPMSETKFDFPEANSHIHFYRNNQNIIDRAEVFEGTTKQGEIRRVKPQEKLILDLDKYVGDYFSEELNNHFSVEVIENELHLTNSSYGDIILTGKTNTVFEPNKDIASTLTFTFDYTDESTANGILLNRGSRVRNLKYRKTTIK